MYVHTWLHICMYIILTYSTYTDIYIKSYTDNSRPTHRELNEKVTPHYAAHWMRIGRFLDISFPALEIIESDNLRNCQKCCDEMLAKWLDIDTTASWGKLKCSIKLAMSEKTCMSQKCIVSVYTQI